MSNLSVRLPWYSFSSLFSWCVILVLAAISPFAGWGLMWTAEILIALWLFAQFGAAIEVTDSVVVLRVWPFGRKTAQRDQIQAMHLFAYFVSFEDPRKTKLLKIATFGWTRRQWLDVSEASGTYTAWLSSADALSAATAGRLNISSGALSRPGKAPSADRRRSSPELAAHWRSAP